MFVIRLRKNSILVSGWFLKECSPQAKGKLVVAPSCLLWEHCCCRHAQHGLRNHKYKDDRVRPSLRRTYHLQRRRQGTAGLHSPITASGEGALQGVLEDSCWCWTGRHPTCSPKSSSPHPHYSLADTSVAPLSQPSDCHTMSLIEVGGSEEQKLGSLRLLTSDFSKSVEEQHLTLNSQDSLVCPEDRIKECFLNAKIHAIY